MRELNRSHPKSETEAVLREGYGIPMPIIGRNNQWNSSLIPVTHDTALDGGS